MHLVALWPFTLPLELGKETVKFLSFTALEMGTKHLTHFPKEMKRQSQSLVQDVWLLKPAVSMAIDYLA